MARLLLLSLAFGRGGCVLGRWTVASILLLGVSVAAAPAAPGEEAADDLRHLDAARVLLLQSLEESTKQVAASVVSVRLGEESVALGTIVDVAGGLVTKASVLRTAAEVQVLLADGQVQTADVVAQDLPSDLALLRLRSADATVPVDLSLDVPPRLGQWVITPALLPRPAAAGIVSALPRHIPGVRLGVALQDVATGPMVTGVLPGMGAAAAGIEPGDLVLTTDGQAVADSAALIAAVQARAEGDLLKLEIKRGDATLSLEIELALPPLDRTSREGRMNTMGNDISRRHDGFAAVLQHDSALDPQQCGGPLLDLDGRCLGINIARAGRIETYALPVALVRDVVDRLLQIEAGHPQ